MLLRYRKDTLHKALSIGRHLLLSEDLLHAEADAGAVAASLTGIFLLWRFSQVVAVLLAQGAADFPVFPEVTLTAASRPVFMVTDTVDQNSFVVIHGNPPFHRCDSPREARKRQNASERMGFLITGAM